MTVQAPAYGYSFDITDIQQVTVIGTLPKGWKANGSTTDKYCFGNFNLHKYDKSKMYIYKNGPSFDSTKKSFCFYQR